ncbi:MAG TPA: hypothetical protein VGG39_26830 [Polyangiaceae bacterium]|jgi:hypothetical protein
MNDEQPIYIEKVGEKTVHHPGTRWKNPLLRAWHMEIQLEGPRANPLFRQNHPPSPENRYLLPPRYLKVTIPPGGEVVLPAFLDSGIQRLLCQDCTVNPFYCTDPSHSKVVIGGLGELLERVAPRVTPTAPEHWRSPDGTPAAAPTTVDDRLMARARGAQ